MDVRNLKTNQSLCYWHKLQIAYYEHDTKLMLHYALFIVSYTLKSHSHRLIDFNDSVYSEVSSKV